MRTRGVVAAASHEPPVSYVSRAPALALELLHKALSPHRERLCSAREAARRRLHAAPRLALVEAEREVTRLERVVNEVEDKGAHGHCFD